jgi:hypothetical protein
MRYRRSTLIAALVCLTGALSLTPLTAADKKAGPKDKASAASKTAIPRTAWGAPDLNGVWTGSTITPLERPKEFADKEFLTAAEAAALEKRAVDSQVDAPPQAGDPGTYNQVWFDPSSKVVPSRRTSLVIDPPDGRIPFTDEGRRQQVRSKARYGKGPYNSWLDLDTGERCITDGLPIYFSGYNNNYQILQTPDYVVIVHELYRETRIIPLDGRPHVGIAQWLGDSRGHWDGNTLVVDTIRFADREHNEWADAWRASRRTTHLVERLTRVDAETVDYQFTWEDPTIFTRPWTAAFPLTNNQASRGVTVGRLYEYACHEGNNALPNVLAGARAQEKSAGATK